ncbi:protein of unknown function [Shewanella benthica]|uniref:Uncharacterized protein n=1 Tax=Shewanella benthica TaxID=43661 RepID=A0A330M8B5_9GAMM|nr:protein of unknown function [Shewanella benthica]
MGTLQELTSYCEHLAKRSRHFSQNCQYLDFYLKIKKPRIFGAFISKKWLTYTQ